MSCRCSVACWFILVCILQLITVAARQAFDFLGLQWTCIVGNFCQIAGAVVGLYGVYRHKPRLLAVYSTWSLIWMGWNIFIIFLYLGVGNLKLEEQLVVLNLGLSDSFTWFRGMELDCNSVISITVTSPPLVMSEKMCFLDFRYIEVFQSAIQLVFSIFGFSFACYVIGVLLEEEDNFDFMGKSPVSAAKNNNLKMHQMQPLVRDPVDVSSSSV